MQPNAVSRYVRNKLILSSISMNTNQWLKTPNPRSKQTTKQIYTIVDTIKTKTLDHKSNQRKTQNQGIQTQKETKTKIQSIKTKTKILKIPFQNHEERRQEGRTSAQKRPGARRRRGFWSFDPWLVLQRDRAVGAASVTQQGRWISLFPKLIYTHHQHKLFQVSTFSFLFSFFLFFFFFFNLI